MNKKRKAFTIVELIIAGAIFAAILGFAISFIRDTQRQAAKATAIGRPTYPSPTTESFSSLFIS